MSGTVDQRSVLVSVIVVTWNSQREIVACLRSIPPALENLPGEIIVVDNQSTDGTPELLKRLQRSIGGMTVVANSQNLGFARANNLAFRIARGEYLLLLNPDAELKPRAITRLVDCLKHRQAGLVGARHRNRDGSTQRSVRRFPTLAAMILLLLKAHRYAPKLPALTRYFADDFDYERTQPAEQLAGSCLLVARPALEIIGGLDERFNIWFEDVDWCRRAHAAGLGVWYCAESEVVHAGGQSFGQLTTLERQRQFNRSLRRYIKKHHGVFAWLIVALCHPISLALAFGTFRLRPRS